MEFFAAVYLVERELQPTIQGPFGHIVFELDNESVGDHYLKISHIGFCNTEDQRQVLDPKDHMCTFQCSNSFAPSLKKLLKEGPTISVFHLLLEK